MAAVSDRDRAGLPVRLRRLAQDVHVPGSACCLLVELAIYVVNPIDLIPDALPVIGQLDEVILVLAILIRVRRMIPRMSGTPMFRSTPDQPIEPKTRAVRSGSPISASSG